MSIHHVERAAELAMLASKKLVFMAFCDSADKDSRISFPGFEMLMIWSGLGSSQVYDVITELIDEGYLRRLKAGRRGQRAEYRVFDSVPCCIEHGPGIDHPLGSGGPDANYTPHPVENPTRKGSGGPEAKAHRVRLASGIGSGQPPVQTGPLPYFPTSLQGGAGALDTNSPLPAPVENPLRCKRHQDQESDGPCGPCGAARRAHEARQADELAARRAAADQKRHNDAVESARIRNQAIDHCHICDDVGRLPSGRLCAHDRQVEFELATSAGVARARQNLLHPQEGTK